MKKNTIILSVILAVAVIGAAVLGIQLGNTGKELEETKLSLTDMTALQGETAAALATTEETLTATGKELEDTKLSLTDMTALQGETAAALAATEETLAATGKELEDTKLSLTDMTALQGETAAALAATEETLTATGKELEDTKLSLADMTALQGDTAAALAATEETLTATGKELEDTKLSLADMTALQGETAAALATTGKELEDTKLALADMTEMQKTTETLLNQTKETLRKTTIELEDTKLALKDMTALQESTAAALKTAQDELAALKPAEEPAAADEPAWTAYTYGSYTVPVLDGWTKYKENEDGTLKYFYYGSSFIMVGVMEMPVVMQTDADIEDAFAGIAEGYLSGGMQMISEEYFQLAGMKSHHLVGKLQGLPVDMILFYTPGEKELLSFSYVQVDSDDARRQQIISLARKYAAPAAAEEEAVPEAAADSVAPAVDYPDDAQFEADLNKGLDLTGKIVTFEIVAYKPTSALGYNLWAGEHLNFVSDTVPQFTTVGEKVTVRVTQVKQMLGSFVIRYEVVE